MVASAASISPGSETEPEIKECSLSPLPVMPCLYPSTMIGLYLHSSGRSMQGGSFFFTSFLTAENGSRNAIKLYALISLGVNAHGVTQEVQGERASCD